VQSHARYGSTVPASSQIHVLRCAVLQESDSAGQKLGGALLNAIIFMAVIGGMTFVLFLLFKWGVSSCSGAGRTTLVAAPDGQT
jgi:hypothetical protein